MTSALLRFAGSGAAMFLICTPAMANTLSDTYYAAYTSPYAFESGFVEKAASKSFFMNFYTCSILAVATLNGMERDARERHKMCKNNSECHKMATEIRDIGYLRDKVQALDQYMKAKAGPNPPSFLQTQAGQWAVEMQKSPYPIPELPLFKGEIALLRSIQCP